MVTVDKPVGWRQSPMLWVVVLAWVLLALVGWYVSQAGPSVPVTHQPLPTTDAALPSTAPLPESAQPDPGSASQAALQTLPGELLASELAAQYSQPDQTLLDRHQGRRFRLLGRVQEQQASAAGVGMVLMEVGQGLPPMRMVMAQGEPAVPLAGQIVTLACVHGGMVMGEPLLRDCRLERTIEP